MIFILFFSGKLIFGTFCRSKWRVRVWWLGIWKSYRRVRKTMSWAFTEMRTGKVLCFPELWFGLRFPDMYVLFHGFLLLISRSWMLILWYVKDGDFLWIFVALILNIPVFMYMQLIVWLICVYVLKCSGKLSLNYLCFLRNRKNSHF